MRRVSDWKMQLAITQNPHTKEPQTLWQELDKMDNPGIRDDEFDREGMMRLKKMLTGSKWIKSN